MTEPCASSTARLTMFSEAISSISWRCRPSSPCTAAAISGSASARVALKKESVAERALVIGEISPRPQVLTQGAVDFLKAVGKDPSPYHKARIRPRNCGSDQIFVPHMVDGGRGKPCPLPLYMRSSGISQAVLRRVEMTATGRSAHSSIPAGFRPAPPAAERRWGIEPADGRLVDEQDVIISSGTKSRRSIIAPSEKGLYETTVSYRPS